MRQFTVGGSTGTIALGEAPSSLDQQNNTCELEEILGLGVIDNDDGVELEATCDDAIDVNDKNTFLVKNMAHMTKKHNIPISLGLKVKQIKDV